MSRTIYSGAQQYVPVLLTTTFPEQKNEFNLFQRNKRRPRRVKAGDPAKLETDSCPSVILHPIIHVRKLAHRKLTIVNSGVYRSEVDA